MTSICVIILIVMFTSNVLMLISLIFMRRALEAKEKEKEAWGRLMYVKGYKDMLEGKPYNPDKGYYTVRAELLVKHICD